MTGLSWEHIDDLGLSLYEAHPDVDPLTVRFTDLHKWITELEDFGGPGTRPAVASCSPLPPHSRA